MKTCSCGADNPDGAKFCSTCGKSLADPVCSACRARTESGAKFCTACGATLPPAGGAPSQATPLIKTPPAQGGDWGPGMVFEPIATITRARAMVMAGCVATAVVAIAFVGVSLFANIPAAGPVLASQWLFAVIYAACAFGLYRNMTVAGLVACLLYAVNVVGGIYLTLKNRALEGAHIPTVQVAIWFVMLIIIPAALISGARGAAAYNRFKRAAP